LEKASKKVGMNGNGSLRRPEFIKSCGADKEEGRRRPQCVNL
jgi:hypothetical protein